MGMGISDHAEKSCVPGVRLDEGNFGRHVLTRPNVKGSTGARRTSISTPGTQRCMEKSEGAGVRECGRHPSSFGWSGMQCGISGNVERNEINTPSHGKRVSQRHTTHPTQVPSICKIKILIPSKNYNAKQNLKFNSCCLELKF